MASRDIFTIPNAISFARILCVPLFLYLIISDRFVLALILLAVCSLSDYIDGYLARKLNQISFLGQILDPVADRLFIFASLIGLLVKGIIDPVLLIIILVREVIIGVIQLRLFIKNIGFLPVTFLGKAGTAMLLFSLPIMLLQYILTGWLKDAFFVISAAVAFWGILLYYYAAALYIYQAHGIFKKYAESEMRSM
ncbi:MAG: CDP-alcohol phosphatidyltransferase family protein [Bifidobacteriaceae bacterium]|jgi:cardiolipin synthase|nr:CDP-alcohol phosphatidyltransferase family protein [Bifidobacteriaceae bacterium]